MILVDSDHVTLLKYPDNTRATTLRGRLAALPEGERVDIPVIVVEEQMRGWLAAIAKERLVLRQVRPYQELAELFDFLSRFEIVGFDERAATEFEPLRSSKIRIGTSDLEDRRDRPREPGPSPFGQPQ